MNGKQNFGIFSKDGKNADTIIKKLSFDYKIKFIFKNQMELKKKIITL